jgi:putative transposase
MVSATVRRQQVAYVRERGVSVRRACRLLSVARSTLRYESVLAKRDAPVIGAMRELSAQYPRFGYRRIRVFLARRGRAMSADRAHRLWRSAGLPVPRRRPRRRIATGRRRQRAPSRANKVWAYDFVFDTCANHQTLNLTVVDEFTRECLAIDVGTSIRSARVIEVLAKLISVRGAPRYLRSACYSGFVESSSFFEVPLGRPIERQIRAGLARRATHRASFGLWVPRERKGPSDQTRSLLSGRALKTTVDLASSSKRLEALGD